VPKTSKFKNWNKDYTNNTISYNSFVVSIEFKAFIKSGCSSMDAMKKQNKNVPIFPPKFFPQQ